MKRRTKTKGKAAAAAASSPDRPAKAKTPREDLLRFGKYMKMRFDRRDEEQKEPNDQETRRRILAGFSRLSAEHFALVDREGLHDCTTQDLADGVCALLGPAMGELGDARLAELCTAILHRCRRNAGKDGIDEQLADEFIRVVSRWAYGAESPGKESEGWPVIRPGMRVFAASDDGSSSNGLVVSTCEHGCFVQDYSDKKGREIAGFAWGDVMVDVDSLTGGKPEQRANKRESTKTDSDGRIAVRPGMKVEGTAADGEAYQGTVTSVCEDGCFMCISGDINGDMPRDRQEGEVLGCTWDTVRVLAAGPAGDKPQRATPAMEAAAAAA